MNGFPDKTKEAMLEVCGWMCAIEGCFNEVEQFHHIVPNTDINNKLWPLFIQSPFNCFPICSTCHMNKPLPKKPSERLIQVYEDYLSSLLYGPSKPS